MTKMNMKAARNIRGFMCQSPAATAVCMASEPLSVIVQRRPDRTSTDHARLLNNTQYARLIEPHSRALASAARRSSTVRSLALKSDHERASKSQVASSLATKDRSLTLKSDQEKASEYQVALSLTTGDQSLALKSDRGKASESQMASSLPTKDQVFQVVDMRVSIHCQGCAGKVKKHLSKMEGVTSFSIDLESKRVTVRGHISPMVVVESMSKVKRAELWPSASCRS